MADIKKIKVGTTTYDVKDSRVDNAEVLAASHITAALGYTPASQADLSGKVNKSGDTMTGNLTINKASGAGSIQIYGNGSPMPLTISNNDTIASIDKGGGSGDINIKLGYAGKLYGSSDYGLLVPSSLTEDKTIATTDQINPKTVAITASQIVSTSPLIINPTDAQKAILEDLNNTLIKMDLSAIYLVIGLDSPYAWIRRNSVKMLAGTSASDYAETYEFDCEANALNSSAEMYKMGKIMALYVNSVVGSTYSTYNKKLLVTKGDYFTSLQERVNNIEAALTGPDGWVVRSFSDIHAGKLDKAGGTMTGALNMSNGININLGDYAYLNGNISGQVNIAAMTSINMSTSAGNINLSSTNGRIIASSGAASINLINNGSSGSDVKFTSCYEEGTLNFYLPADDAEYDIGGSTKTTILASREWVSAGIPTRAVGGATSIRLKFWKGTQAQYNSITTPDANTFYIIVG